MTIYLHYNGVERILLPPLGIDQAKQNGNQSLTIAIGNISYLGTIGDFIKRRAAEKGLECIFVEKAPEEIQKLLDDAAQQRLIKETDLEGFEFTDESILDALQDADQGESNGGFNFDFDDSDEQIIEEEALDLSIEMMGTKYNKQLLRSL